MGIRVWGVLGWLLVVGWASVIVLLCCAVVMGNAIGNHSLGFFGDGCWLGLCNYCVVFF